MTEQHFDVAVIGSGFGGSLTALILKQIGLSPVVIDRGSHPRLVLGESSTPLANMVLQSLAKKYGLVRLRPVGEYRTGRRAHRRRSLRREGGCMYFRRGPGHPFPPPAHPAH